MHRQGHDKNSTGDAAGGEPAESRSPSSPQKHATGMQRILLVEDNELNRDMLGRRLARHGYEILVAADGHSGLALAAEASPHLIIMDMGLPGMDGWEATRRLKADVRTRHIPVIGLSAHAFDGDRCRALECGCDDYDTKPVDIDRLVAKIRSLLEASHTVAD